MEDALISSESFSILSGAGLIAATEKAPIYVHTTSQIEVKDDNTIVLPNIACWNKYNKNDNKEKSYYHDSADIFVMAMLDGEISAEPCVPIAAEIDTLNDQTILTCYSHAGKIEAGDVVLVDYYIKRTSGAQTIEITPDKFGGNYYLEASTLFRREADGIDMPAEFIIPNCKVQSNFTFSMASTGDPSTFSFVLDAFPDYTKFDKTHKVLAAIQVIEDQFDKEDETRAPCEEPQIRFAPVDSNLALTYDNDSTEKDVKITVTGANIIGNEKSITEENDGVLGYDKELFNANNELKDINATQVNIKFVDINKDKQYRIIQSNPALTLYPNDEFIEGNIKDKVYSGRDLVMDDDGYGVILTNRSGAINIKVYEIDGKNEALTQSVKITNRVSFVAIPKAE